MDETWTLANERKRRLNNQKKKRKKGHCRNFHLLVKKRKVNHKK